MSGDAVVLSSGDTRLTVRDAALLSNPRAWLNDALVSWWFAELSAAAEAAQCPSLALLDASVCHFLAFCSRNDVAAVAAPLSLATRELVLCIVSDSAATSEAAAADGTHWTLLVSRKAGGGQFELWDSLQGGARSAAVAARVAASLAHAWREAKSIAQSGAVAVQPVRLLCQTNGHDCGLHALLAAELICDAVCRGLDASAAALADQITPGGAAALRPRMHARLAQLAPAAQAGE